MPADLDEPASHQERDETPFNDESSEAYPGPVDDDTTEDTSDSKFPALGYLIIGIRHLVLGISIVIWSIVGFIFWVPMLLFSILHFSALILYATLTVANPSHLASRLEHAVRFYVDGFKIIIEAVCRTDNTLAPTVELHIDRTQLAKHIFVTLGFWLVVVLVVLLSVGTFQWSELYSVLMDTGSV